MDNGQSAYDFYVSKGETPQAAAGIVGNLQGESGQGLNPNAVSPGDGRDGSDSIGIAQWNGTRAQALKDYAASKSAPWNDLNTQLEFLHSELKGPESKAYAGLTAAKTPEEAGQAMLAFERPKDWNVPGAHPERAQYAARAYSAYGGGAAPAPGLLNTAPGAWPASGSSPVQAPLSLAPPPAAQGTKVTFGGGGGAAPAAAAAPAAPQQMFNILPQRKLYQQPAPFSLRGIA